MYLSGGYQSKMGHCGKWIWGKGEREKGEGGAGGAGGVGGGGGVGGVGEQGRKVKSTAS
ncbi:hypothetical protein MiSe_92590 [Microseira wollei NIES-4236]|uniref:Uncharacterized protein n=1 Tax=Microseira wollei NIES-4236 TaxID=2530354 RepID=A0AAV3XNC4_9CYAN|nr:hypothetical protein MiSe_92590 [Microseira wollei NIES-4236]